MGLAGNIRTTLIMLEEQTGKERLREENKMNLTPRAEGPDQDAGTENLIGGL